MQITCLTLEKYLTNQAPRLCLIWGSETHWVEESKKILLQYFDTRDEKLEKLFIHFDQPEKALSEFAQAIQMPGLFCAQKLIICLVNNALNLSSRKRLAELISQLPDSYRLILQFEKVSAAQQKEAWYQHCLQQGVVVTHWPLSITQYKQYLNQRAAKWHYSLTPSALQFIAQMTEGNALAGIQTLEKLKLSLGENHTAVISEDEIIPLIGQNARYTLNDLYYAILENDARRTQAVLDSFQETKTPLPLIVWGLHQLLQAIALPFFKHSGLYASSVLPKTPSFQNLIEKKQRQCSFSLIIHFIESLHMLDKQLKSYQSEQRCWQACFIFCLQFTNCAKTSQNGNLGL